MAGDSLEVARQRWQTLQAEARESVGLAAPVFLQDGELVAPSDQGSESNVEAAQGRRSTRGAERPVKNDSSVLDDFRGRVDTGRQPHSGKMKSGFPFFNHKLHHSRK
jgi:hypothetical protein